MLATGSNDGSVPAVVRGRQTR